MRRPGEISLPPGSGIGKGRRCTCWPRPDDARACTPQTCDWGCRACLDRGQPFYSHGGDLQYLEHGSGPLAGELDRLWRAKGTRKGGAAREGARHDVDRWRALPRGATRLGSRRQPHGKGSVLTPGQQDLTVGGDGRSPTRSGR